MLELGSVIDSSLCCCRLLFLGFSAEDFPLTLELSTADESMSSGSEYTCS